MKQTFLLVIISLLFISIISCKKEQPVVDQLSLLPPITSNGANTFGCLIDGLAYLPKGSNSGCTNPFATPPIELVFRDSGIAQIDFNNASSTCSFSPENFLLRFHIANYKSLKNGDSYMWRESNWGTGSNFPFYQNYIVGSIYDDSLKIPYWFNSYYNSGSTFINKIDTSNRIISGTFQGKLKMRDGTREKNITNGRFDIKW